MSDPIGPGDWVECVDASPCDYEQDLPVISGQIYQIRDVHWGVRVGGSRGLGCRLVGIVRPANELGRERGLRLERFRPIYRPKQSIIEALKISELIDEGERSEVRVSQKDNA